MRQVRRVRRPLQEVQARPDERQIMVQSPQARVLRPPVLREAEGQEARVAPDECELAQVWEAALDGAVDAPARLDEGERAQVGRDGAEEGRDDVVVPLVEAVLRRAPLLRLPLHSCEELRPRRRRGRMLRMRCLRLEGRGRAVGHGCAVFFPAEE